MPNKVYKILKDGKIMSSFIPGIYAGYKKGKIFGRLDCKSGKRMKGENRVFFHSMKEAILQGYRPCKNCRPLNVEQFNEIKHLIPEHKTLEDFYNRDNKPKNSIKNSKKSLLDI